MANKLERTIRLLSLCVTLAITTATLWTLPVVLGQTTFKSSAERSMRRIEEHQQLRRAALELTQDLRAIQLTPEQRQEIHRVLKRYNTSTGTTRRDPNSEIPATESGIQPTSEGSAPPQVAERLRTEVAALLTSEQSDQLNSIRQEREERAQKYPDFHLKRKP